MPARTGAARRAGTGCWLARVNMPVSSARRTKNSTATTWSGEASAVEGAREVAEDAAEVDVLLGDARRDDVVEARERLIGWPEPRSRRLGGVVPDAVVDGGVEEVVDDGEAGDECGAEHQ